MKAALAAAAFASFDPDKNGVVEMEDIARVFGHIKTDGLDAEKVVRSKTMCSYVTQVT